MLWCVHTECLALVAAWRDSRLCAFDVFRLELRLRFFCPSVVRHLMYFASRCISGLGFFSFFVFKITFTESVCINCLSVVLIYALEIDDVWFELL